MSQGCFISQHDLFAHSTSMHISIPLFIFLMQNFQDTEIRASTSFLVLFWGFHHKVEEASVFSIELNGKFSYRRWLVYSQLGSWGKVNTDWKSCLHNSGHASQTPQSVAYRWPNLPYHKASESARPWDLFPNYEPLNLRILGVLQKFLKSFQKKRGKNSIQKNKWQTLSLNNSRSAHPF